ncbi:MAG: glycosyltransferase family 4 protein [Planctomycetaceae bacterium]|jgi:glycosyltransferase involved in cell wall biosynthesis|nr:glycosyltransferase family 4 protein [Planctomycetaceae bacterium]
MRVVHIITRLIVGGAQENTLLNCADLVSDFGDDVLLIIGAETGLEGSLLSAIEEKFPVLVLPELVRSISPYRDICAYYNLRRHLMDFKPDVVHTHSAKAGIIGRLAAWNLKVPLVVHTVHGAPFYPYQNRFVRIFYQFCERFVARRCHAIISVADAMTDLMTKARIAPHEKFTTIYSGIEVDPFLNSEQFRTKTRERFGIGKDDIVVGKIARLFYLKGHEYVVAAAESILHAVPVVKFMFVGDGILLEKFRRDVELRGISDRFVFTGLLPPEQIPAVISAMDIVVHTSLREGLARVLPQALLAGKPVISYDIDGAREVVIDGVTGYLLPPKSIKQLENAIIKLATSPDLRIKFGQNGKELCENKFDHHNMTAQIRKLYESHLNSSNVNTVDLFLNN